MRLLTALLVLLMSASAANAARSTLLKKIGSAISKTAIQVSDDLFRKACADSPQKDSLSECLSRYADKVSEGLHGDNTKTSPLDGPQE